MLGTKSQRTGSVHAAVDVALAAALVATLGVVFWLDGSTPIDADPTQKMKLAVEPEPVKVSPLRIAVMPETPQYDDMGQLLRTLGRGYKFTSLPLDALLDPVQLAEFDIIFITCSGYPSSWLKDRVGTRDRDGELYKLDDETFDRAKVVLRGFVEKGGTLYASDWHYLLIAHSFPEFAAPSGAIPGEEQTLTADVVDQGLRERIGGTIELNFDLGGWRPAAFTGDKLTEYLRGSYRSELGGNRSSPLLVKFPVGDGTVIFTSFHNEKQNNEAEIKLLEYLVFSAVTANVQSQVDRTMVQGGFSPTKNNLFSASSQAESVSQSYHNAAVTDLQFVLGFQGRGATLRLSVVGPDGKTLDTVGTSTVTIDVPQAAIGDWKYSVTAVQVPSENFPFTVTIGRK